MLFMEKPAFNYVRTFRQRFALSEKELAFLINRSKSTISALEYGDQAPSLEVSLALQVLFRMEPRKLFPEFYELVEEGVMQRAARLLAKVEDKVDRKSAAKRHFLEGLARPEDNDASV
jgi:DNA-binding XRE family transcriptional regulator